MGTGQKYPLHQFSSYEEQELHRIAKATSERLDLVKRATVLLHVQAGVTFTEADRDIGYKSGDSISQLVERFNQRGLAALRTAPGRGRKPTYTAEQRARIVAEVQRTGSDRDVVADAAPTRPSRDRSATHLHRDDS